MIIGFINLIQSGGQIVDRPRSSSLTPTSDGESLAVVGVLPHGYVFRPKTARDRDALVEYLKQLEYSQ